ncbi:MAG: nucleotidyltransferase domain-containing protein [Planctomycetes bacterium]|nr:nucleotidyltransferase domain-containing protein [Planctomycetota bacterium]
MAKTALDLTPDELRRYKPERSQDQKSMDDRLKKAMALALKAAGILKIRFGAKRVVLFGSLSHKEWFTPWSDIDLSVAGIKDQDFYQAVATVSGLSPDFKIEIIDFNSCPPKMKEKIEAEGIEV